MTKHCVDMTLRAPSKTFLLGEYAVLAGGQGLIVATPPYFQLTISTQSSTLLPASKLFHQDSPAGKLIALYPELEQYHYHFQDPHHGQGGFGASSAQFLLLYQFLNQHIGTENSLKQLYQCFRDVTHTDKYPPSGADVMCQAHGQICHFQGAKSHHQNWPFESLVLCLIRTGKKLATHEHLTTLSELNLDTLLPLIEQAANALAHIDADAFCDAIKAYGSALAERKWVAPQTEMLLNNLHDLPGVRAAKGCGAMGADVMLAIVSKARLNEFKVALSELKLDLVFSNQPLALGSFFEPTNNFKGDRT